MKIEKLTNYLNLNREEFSFQFQSHPHYPSALAFSDTLNFLGVKNEVYKLQKEFWHELPEEFITITNNHFSLIKKDQKNYKAFSADEKIFSQEELYQNSLDVVMLFENIEINTTDSSKNFQFTIYLFLGLILLFSLWQNSFTGFLFNLLSVIGLFISLELFNNKFGQESVAIKTVCGGNANAIFANSCSKIIESDNISLLGLKLSDFSLVYFMGILVLGIFVPTTEFVFQLLTLPSALIIFYSLYVQIFVEKVICKICLLIITVLILQIVIAILYFQFIFSVPVVILSLLAFSALLSGVAFINKLLTKNDELKKSNIKNLKFKRNYEVFKREFLLEDKVHFKDNDSGFFFGNPQSKLHISLVSNPFCGFCKDAHLIFENLHAKYSQTISFQVRFNYLPENANEDLTELMKSLTKIYKNNPKEFLSALHLWFEKKDLTKIKEKHKNDSSNADLYIFTEITQDNIANRLNFTPIFLINGYKFPHSYDRDDIFYFIDELLEDEEITKKKRF